MAQRKNLRKHRQDQCAQRRAPLVSRLAYRPFRAARRRAAVLERRASAPSIRDEAERRHRPSDAYSTEGGHDPVRRPGNTRDELKFRGSLTPPSEAPAR